jgi:DNA-binding beta-propeller fold protein YncE
MVATARYSAKVLVPWVALVMLPSLLRAAPMSSASFAVTADAFSGGGAVGISGGGVIVGTTIGQAAPLGGSNNAAVTNAPGVWPAFSALATATPSTPTRTPTRATPTRTPTILGGHTATPSRTPTLTLTAAPTRTPTVLTPTITRTPSKTPTLPTRTPTATATAIAPGFYPRGDSNCSVALSVPDVQAVVRAVGDVSTCSNDDCDRDGRVTAADIDCTVHCLFGACSIPPDAPRATAVHPVTAPGIVPFSVVLVDVDNLGSDADFDRVTFGGIETEVIGREGTNALRVVVPDVSVGRTDVVVLAGDVAGPALRVGVDAAQAIGATDDTAGTLDLLIQTTDQLLALNLEAAVNPTTSGAQGQAAIDATALIAALRAQIQTVRSAASTFRDLLRDPQQAGWAALDHAIEASGLPERLKALVPDLVGTAITERDKLRRAAEVYRDLSRFLDTAGQLKRTLDPAIAAALDEARAELARVGVIVSDELRGLTEQSLEKLGIVLKVAFSDAVENARQYPTAGGRVRVFYRQFGLLEVDDLSVDFASGRLQLDPETSGDGFYDYRLPDTVGICGPVRIRYQALELGGLIGLSGLHTSIQPELLDLGTDVAASRDGVALRTRGVLGCRSEALFTRVATDPPRGRIIERATSVTAQSANVASASVPVVPPDRYRVTARVAGVASTEVRELRIQTAAHGLDVFCLSTQLFLPPASPSETSCTAVALPSPGDIPSEPDSGFVFEWQSEPGAIVELRDDTPTLADVRVLATHAGNTDLTVVAKTDRDVRVAGTTNAAAIHVADVTAPNVLLSTVAVDLVPGGFIKVTAKATDNDGLTRIVLTATGEAVSTLDFPADLPCSRGRSCSREWTLSLKRAEFFTDGHIRVRAETFDTAGSSGLSNTLEFFIEPAATATPTATPTATRTPLADVLGYVGIETVGQPIRVVDVAANRVVGSIALSASGVARDIVIDRGGTRAYVLRSASAMFVDVLDLSAGTSLLAIPVCSGAGKLALRADDAFLYVTCRSEDRLDVVRTSTHTVARTVELGTGAHPKYVAVAPSGDVAYVILDRSDDIVILDTATDAQRRTIKGFDLGHAAVAFASDGTTAYVVSTHAVTIYEAASGTFAGQIPLDNPTSLGPVDIVVTPNGQKAYANVTQLVGTGRLFAIDLVTKQVVKVLDFSQPTFHLALSPDGQSLYVTGRVSRTTIQVIARATDTVVGQVDLASAGAIVIAHAP